MAEIFLQSKQKVFAKLNQSSNLYILICTFKALKEARNNGKLILSDTNMLDSSSVVKKTSAERDVSIIENRNRGYDRINDSALVIT